MGQFFFLLQMAKKEKIPRKPTIKQTLVKDLRDQIKKASATLRVHKRNLNSLLGRKKTQAQKSKEILKALNNG